MLGFKCKVLNIPLARLSIVHVLHIEHPGRTVLRQKILFPSKHSRRLLHHPHVSLQKYCSSDFNKKIWCKKTPYRAKFSHLDCLFRRGTITKYLLLEFHINYHFICTTLKGSQIREYIVVTKILPSHSIPQPPKKIRYLHYIEISRQNKNIRHCG